MENIKVGKEIEVMVNGKWQKGTVRHKGLNNIRVRVEGIEVTKEIGKGEIRICL